MNSKISIRRTNMQEHKDYPGFSIYHNFLYVSYQKHVRIFILIFKKKVQRLELRS
jgi:hypothetical protein